MNKRILFVFALCSVIFTSCETEVDLFTEEGQVPVVFALLEPDKEVQFFRINPTFIGDGDARILAGDPSLTNYKAGEIEVKLIDLTSDIEYPLKDSIGYIDLDEDGIFDAQNRIYYLETEVQILSDGTVDNEVLKAGNEYQLWIKHNKTGAVTTGNTVLGDINRLQMAIPRKGLSVQSSNWLDFYSGTNYNSSYTFEFDADALSERFKMEARFYYTEGSEDLNSKNRFVQFEIGEKNELDDLGSQFKRVTMDYDGEKFYSLLATRLSPMLDRTGQTFDLITTAVGPDLDLYITVQDASLSGLSQEKPSFTNITNGLGVFSYRLTKTFTEFKMTQTSAVQLFEGPYTFDLFRCCRHGSQSNTEGVIPCRQ